ncbi:MAG: hypothetical protein AAFZ07_27895 [Actinomycetota bacterium]
MVGLIAVGVVAGLLAALAVVAHRQDVRRKRSGTPTGGRSFQETQADIVTKAGNTASGDGTGFGAL